MNVNVIGIFWSSSSDPEFKFEGKVLTISRMEASKAGTYTCTAWNFIHPTGTPASFKV